jgi:hypothetical protein
MGNNNLYSRIGALACRPYDAKLALFTRLAALIVVAMGFAIPSQCSAQTLNLGPDSSYGIFANGGHLTLSGTTVNGGLDMSSSTILSKTGSQITTTNSHATALATTLPSGNNGSINGTTYSAAKTGTVSVFTLPNVLSGGKMTLKGAAGDTFIFNVKGSFNMSGVTMVLSGGIDASHILFISSNTATVSGSTIFGTFYNSGVSTFSGDTVTGAIVDGNNGLTVSGSTINASPFAGGSAIAGAPETPTIMTAALAAFLIMGSSGFRYLRRRRCASRAEFTAH